MSFKVQAKQSTKSRELDPFAEGVSAPIKTDPAEMKNKVLAILREPCAVDAKKLVQRATYGANMDTFDAFDPVAVQSKMKGKPTP